MAETFSFLVDSVQAVADRYEVSGVLLSATTKARRVFQVVDLADLTRQGKSAAAKRPEEEAKKDQIVVGAVVDVTPDAPAVVIPPTPDELAKAAWQAAHFKALAALQHVSPIPYRAADDPEIVALVDAALALYKPTYTVTA